MNVTYKENRYILLYNVLTKLKEKYPQIEIKYPNDFHYYYVKELAKKYNVATGFTLCAKNFKLSGNIEENPFFQRDVCIFLKKPCESYVIGSNGVGNNGYSNQGSDAFPLGTSTLNITKDENGETVSLPLTEDELYEHLETNIRSTFERFGESAI